MKQEKFEQFQKSIDDTLLEEAQTPKKKHHYAAWAVAACLCVALVGVFTWQSRLPAATEEQNVEIPNPIEDVTADELDVTPPAGAEDVNYTTIGGTLKQMMFTLNGVSYTYRSAAAEEPTDLSGIYDAEQDVKDWEENGLQLTQCDGPSGSWIGWFDGTTQHCLSAQQPSEEILPLAQELMAQ